MKNRQTQTLRALTESAVMIALATVLSFIKIIDMPYGGSVTIASMLPVALISYRHGAKWGLTSATVYGVIQQLLGLSTLSWFTSWQSIVAIILLDYVVAFAVIGFAGIFRKSIKSQAIALAFGCFGVAILRYICHVISGATVWVGLSIPDYAALSFSFAYNATYMLPETIILLVVAVYVGSMVDFKATVPSRIKHGGTPANLGWIAPVSGLIAVIAIIADTVLVFQNIQDEDGNFVIESLANVNWTLVIAITAVGALIVGALLAIRGALAARAKNL
ncbi:MAG: energy-coupled thiamine transporter ThiT [Clostridia bacterium]|nr:energy-coupled thiamine transporter ThiT [Clostridia bacterium]